MTGYDYDIGIVGGGLAGLTAAIQLRQKGYRVALWEQKKYPFHRVCGEYISMESWAYLVSCGIDLPALELPIISKLQVSAPDGSLLEADLNPGGFGISRYWLDHLLYEEARRRGVVVFDSCKVTQLVAARGHYELLAAGSRFKLKLALGSFGKRSNLDLTWKRSFVTQKAKVLDNYIGIKYHIQTDLPAHIISLHNFKNGYCGVSKIEADKYCLCYLTTAANLQAAGGIREMEKNILYHNPHLRRIFEQSEFLFTEPVTISQISFTGKETVYKGTPLAGDACGMITPLCGNGMTMALQSSKIFTNLANAFLRQEMSLDKMQQAYEIAWRRQFARRLWVGRMVQANFGKEWQTKLFVNILKRLPSLTQQIIKATHGTPF